MWTIKQEDYLMHHGIKGQKWGIRRYQNEDGSLTSEGRQRYKQLEKDYNKFKNTEKRLLKEGGDYATKQVYGNAYNMSLDKDRKYENRWVNTRYEYTYRRLREDPSYKKLIEDYLQDEDFKTVFNTKISDVMSDTNYVKNINKYIDWLYE